MKKFAILSLILSTLSSMSSASQIKSSFDCSTFAGFVPIFENDYRNKVPFDSSVINTVIDLRNEGNFNPANESHLMSIAGYVYSNLSNWYSLSTKEMQDSVYDSRKEGNW